MIHTTKGIVLHSFSYSDTSIIARILTRNTGLQSYLIPGVKKSKSRIRASLFQPFTIVEMVAYQKEHGGLQRIKEIRCSHPTPSIGLDVRKSSVAIFLCEVLLQAFKHQEPQPEAFDFIVDSIERLDDTEDSPALFHHLFLVALTRFLGFAPSGNYSPQRRHFNLREGIFQQQEDISGICLSESESALLHQLLQENTGGVITQKTTAVLRASLLKSILDFYRFHMDGFAEIKSLPVLQAVFSD